MAKSKEQKKEIIKKLHACFSQAKLVIFSSFNALTVKENEELRKNLKAENNEYIVVKKTLLQLAAKEWLGSQAEKIKNFTGKISAVFSYGDETSSSKIIDKFRKNYENKIQFLGGIFDNKFIEAGEVEALSKLPSRQEIYGQIVGSLNSPLTGLINALSGNLKNLIFVLTAIKEKAQK